MCGCGKMSNILDQEETRKTLEKTQSKNTRNEKRHSGQVSGKKYGNSEGSKIQRCFRSHQQGNPSKVSTTER